MHFFRLQILLILLLALGAASLACRSEKLTPAIKILHPAEAPRELARNPNRADSRILYAQPWPEDLVELSFYAPRFIKPLLKPSDPDSWFWERLAPTRYRFGLRPSPEAEIALNGIMNVDGPRLRIEGDLVNRRDVMLWEELLILTLNFSNAASFRGGMASKVLLYPERSDYPSSVGTLLAEENSPFKGQPAFLFWINHPNESWHRPWVRQTASAGPRKITAEGEPLLAIAGDQNAADLDLRFSVTAKPDQASHFAATITFEE